MLILSVQHILMFNNELVKWLEIKYVATASDDEHASFIYASRLVLKRQAIKKFNALLKQKWWAP